MVAGAVACGAPSVGIEGFDTTLIEVGGESLTVAVADTPSLRSQGLRGVAALPEGMDGMIFVFDAPTTATFGMRDTLIPLDIWWFDDSGRLLGSTEMEPCSAAPCPGYASPGEIKWALETPAGGLDSIPGDRLTVVDSR